jgi:hypothetical protein
MAVLSYNRFPTDRCRPNAALDGRTVAICRLGALDLNGRLAGAAGLMTAWPRSGSGC